MRGWVSEMENQERLEKEAIERERKDIQTIVQQSTFNKSKACITLKAALRANKFQNELLIALRTSLKFDLLLYLEIFSQK